MPAQFKEITLPSLTGAFDALSTNDAIGVGNFRLRKNFSVRSPTKLCRRGGWTRFFDETTPYNNQDLHDQLVGLQGYYDQLTGFFNIPGGVCGYSYPYFTPSSSTDMYDTIVSSTFACGYYVEQPYPLVFTSDACFIERWNVGFPYEVSFPNYGPCNSGDPWYYEGSWFYVDCSEHFDPVVTAGYGYGTQSPIYCNPLAYSIDYCGTYLWPRLGCREAITLLHEANGSMGRRLIAATMSRILEYNHGTGDWVLLADGLGNAAFTEAQCDCNDVRFMADSLGDYTILVNGFNEPLLRQMGGLHEGCNVWAANPIEDLKFLDVSAAGGVVAWKGFFFLFDYTANGVRNPGGIIWSDFDNPLSWVPTDTSQAGSATVAVGETFLAAAELGNFLYLYSDRSIWRVTLVGGDVLFSFDQIYSGTSALKFKYSLVNTGSEHLYLGQDKIYMFTQFDQRPIEVDWIVKASAAIYRGMGEKDAMFSPINKNRCNQAVGGWNEEFKEVWFSWPTGNNSCPDMTMALNMQYQAADLIDYGFTSFISMRPDTQPTVAQWLETIQACTFEQLFDVMTKEGRPCESETTFPDPPLYLINPTEDINLPVHPDSLCAALAGKTEDDFCRDCSVETRFLMASASDFTIKQYEDATYYREEYSDTYGSYCAIDCDGLAYYFCLGYDSVLQTGADDYRSDNEKIIRRLVFDAEPVPQTVPSKLDCYVGFSAQSNCDVFVKLESQDLKCLDRRTDRQREDQFIRSDQRLNFPTFYRGKYISWKIKITGLGGGTCFGSSTAEIRVAEAAFTR